ncbi:hypothetical protein HBN54_004563 [Hymenobacter sp. 1B]|uniref:Uncharacterized protein n=1 Tax=Hymenobacter artigasi TaxID=2719616 RepID=A0ABX1HP30_9BACT|nr:hypothetical protein [Hymenobacter artigasi]
MALLTQPGSIGLVKSAFFCKSLLSLTKGHGPTTLCRAPQFLLIQLLAAVRLHGL